MLKSVNSTTTILGLLVLTVSCSQKRNHGLLDPNRNARLSAISMPIPPELKAHIGADKIDAYSLEVQGGSCATGSVGTNIPKKTGSLSPDDKLANERLAKNCDYVFILSLGKANSSGTALEKIYLTNDLDGQRTSITRDKTQGDKIQITVRLSVTADGQADLGIENTPVPVPSDSEVDANIDVKIGRSPTNPIPTPSLSYDWKQNIVWSEVKTYAFSGPDHGSPFYKDVMIHTPESERFFKDGGWSTFAHETQHGLVATMRNLTPKDDGFFYFENGKGAYVDQPKKVMGKVKDYVGANFRAETQSRYDLYLVQQATSWPEVLYLFDEWNAYVATSRSAIEMKTMGEWDNSNSDPFDGIADFLYYCSASIVALKDHDPTYLESNKQFKAAFAMLVEQSVDYIQKGAAIDQWKSTKATKRLNMLRSDAENEKIRSTLRSYMGAEWTKSVLGF